MGRSMHKFSYFSLPYSGEEKMLLQLDLAGKVLYLLTLIVLLLLYLRKWKRNRGGGRRHGQRFQTTNRDNVVRGDNGGETIRGQISRRVRANLAGGEVGVTTGGQYAGEVRFEVAGDDDSGTINGDIARRVRADVAGGEVGDTTGGQYAGEVRFDVAGDDDGGTINSEIAMGRITSLAATMPFEFN